MLQKIIFTLSIIIISIGSYGQVTIPQDRFPGQNSPNQGFPAEQNPQVKQEISVDSLRNQLENRKDSVIYNSKYIKFTKEEFLIDSTRVFELDTTTSGFHHFHPLYKPRNPTMNLGVLGMASRPMLFEPAKSIGFDIGYHFFDNYMITPKDIKYYQARSQYTELYYVSPLGGKNEELFHVLHSQNIRPNWNVGGMFGKMGAQGFYAGQKADILNASVWNWYESNNKRYTLLANMTFNTIKSYESGSILNDSIFKVSTVVDPLFEQTRLEKDAMHDVRNNTFYVKQFYNIGKQKEVDGEVVLPTQRVSYSFAYNRQKYFFRKDTRDDTGLLRNYYIFQDSTSDSTIVNHLKNEFNYSFYLRGKSVSFLKNELKLNVGIQQDYYNYKQFTYDTKFQNLSLKGSLNYGFSDKASLQLKLQQMFQGRNAGDFLYEAESEIKLSNNVGRIVLGAYSQNQSPALVFERQYTNHHRWTNNYDNVKTQNLSFTYLNPKYHLSAKAEYFLVSNHLYFRNLAGDIVPDQLGSNINLLKLSLGKDFKFGKFTFENYLVYQKTDFESVLRTPEVYTFHSFYMRQNIVKVLKTEFGFDVRYFSEYTMNSYAPAIGQFYNQGNVKAETWPIVDVWFRTNWKRANIFVRYDYANQGLFSKGYYTVNNYPMPYSLARFGFSWNFYD